MKRIVQRRNTPVSLAVKSPPDAEHVEGLPGLGQQSKWGELARLSCNSRHATVKSRNSRDAKHVEGLPGLRQ